MTYLLFANQSRLSHLSVLLQLLRLQCSTGDWVFIQCPHDSMSFYWKIGSWSEQEKVVQEGEDRLYEGKGAKGKPRLAEGCLYV